MESLEKDIKEKIKNMTLKQKLEYYWEYHKWKVIIPLAILVFLVTFITSVIEEKKPTALTIAMVNANNISGALITFTEEYPTEMGIDIEKTPVRVVADFRHPKEKKDAAFMDTQDISSIQRYQAMITNSYIDVAISPTWAVDEYQTTGVYQNLEELFPKDFLEEYRDLLYYSKTGEKEDIPVGFKMEKSKLFNDFYKDGMAVLTVNSYSKKKEEAVRFVQWMIKDSK